MTGKLVALVGLAGSGKDEAAKALIEDGWVRVSFAEPMREMLLALDPEVTYRGCTMLLSGIVRQFGWDEAKRVCPPIRRLLQRLGTEVGRNILGTDVWVDWSEEKIASLIKEGTNVVITDCRFPNEAELVKRWDGKIIKLRRAGVTQMLHSSELLDFEVDLVLHNEGTVEELHAAVREAVDA